MGGGNLGSRIRAGGPARLYTGREEALRVDQVPAPPRAPAEMGFLGGGFLPLWRPALAIGALLFHGVRAGAHPGGFPRDGPSAAARSTGFSGAQEPKSRSSRPRALRKWSESHQPTPGHDPPRFPEYAPPSVQPGFFGFFPKTLHVRPAASPVKRRHAWRNLRPGTRRSGRSGPRRAWNMPIADRLPQATQRPTYP